MFAVKLLFLIPFASMIPLLCVVAKLSLHTSYYFCLSRSHSTAVTKLSSPTTAGFCQPSKVAG
jgi:hypothetical protein